MHEDNNADTSQPFFRDYSHQMFGKYMQCKLHTDGLYYSVIDFDSKTGIWPKTDALPSRFGSYTAEHRKRVEQIHLKAAQAMMDAALKPARISKPGRWRKSVAILKALIS